MGRIITFAVTIFKAKNMYGLTFRDYRFKNKQTKKNVPTTLRNLYHFVENDKGMKKTSDVIMETP